MKSHKFLSIIFSLLIYDFTIAQSDTIIVHADSLSNQTDIIDVYRKIFKRPVKPQGPLKSRKVAYSGLPGAGYTLQTKFAIAFAMNAAFFTGDKKTTNLSVINITPVYTQNKQFIFQIQSNVWAKQNTYDFPGDFRYYKYPQSSYGLGGHTSLSVTNPMDYSYVSVRQAALKLFTNDFFAGVGYAFDYHFNITEKGNSNGTESDYHKYGDGVSSLSSGITFHFLHDNRRNPINPKSGFYSNFIYRANITYLGSNDNWQSLIIDVRKYFKIQRKNTLAFWSYNWFTFGGKVPYLDLPGTGWDTYSNTGRGYIQSRLRGKNFVFLEAEYRFGILKNGLFGGVVFDAQFVYTSILCVI